MTMKNTPNMAVNIAGIQMKNPVMNAAGCGGYGPKLAEFFDLNIMGAFTLKGLTLEPRKGSDPQEGSRIAETPCGVINRIGLENPGAEEFISEKIPWLKKHCPDLPVIVNINGGTIEEYVQCAKMLSYEAEGVTALEVNLGCPNVRKGGAAFGKDARIASNIVHAILDALYIWLPLIVKLTPDVTDIAEIAKAVEAAGAEAVSLINTAKARGKIKSGPHAAEWVVGGLSGPAIKPIALQKVAEVAEAVDIPVIGMGGIMTWEDAIDFLGVGASAVAVGTANFWNKHAIPEIIAGLEQYMTDNDIPDIHELIGRYI